LCGQPIDPSDHWDRDHVPPQRLYSAAVRSGARVNLTWLPTHILCNRAYREDEEYFVVSFGGHAQTKTGDSVMRDLARAYAKGHSEGFDSKRCQTVWEGNAR
jgi:hypothetical protein